MELVLQHDPPRKIAPLGRTMAETLDNLLDVLKAQARPSKLPPITSDAELIRRVPELQQHEDPDMDDEQLPDTQQDEGDHMGLVQTFSGGIPPWRRGDAEDAGDRRGPPIKTKRKWLMPTRRRAWRRGHYASSGYADA